VKYQAMYRKDWTGSIQCCIKYTVKVRPREVPGDVQERLDKKYTMLYKIYSRGTNMEIPGNVQERLDKKYTMLYQIYSEGTTT